uniref:Class V chitinase n=3 Tax=Pinus subgen. Pinus TaxID=139271 RepID=A0A5C0ZSD3_PINBN|nr:class V chitinase [Pinus banksiana]
MAQAPKNLCIILFFITSSIIYSSSSSNNTTSNNGVKAAYWPSDSSLSPSSISTDLFTHIFYAFADLNDQTFQVQLPATADPAEFTSTLLQKNPSLKTLISIGGGGSNATAFALMASNTSYRKVFINSTIALARKYGFHGLDLDWEFPQDAAEMEYLGTLFDDWRHDIDLEATASGRPRLLLTAAVYFAQYFFVWGEKRAYPVTSIARNLDWVNVMCYDYHGSWDISATGAHAALYDPTSNISTSFGIGSWLHSGVPPNKVAMGMPLYGRSWILKSLDETEIGAPAVAAGPKQTLSNEKGVMFFSEIRELINQKNATEVFDKETVSAYSYSSDLLWVGYDNQESVATKVSFAKEMHLLGYFFWAIGQDNNWMLSAQASDSWN